MLKHPIVTLSLIFSSPLQADLPPVDESLLKLFDAMATPTKPVTP